MDKAIYSREAEALRRVIKAVRKEKSLTQVEVAARLGSTQSYLSKVEQGELMIDAAVLIQLCRAMEIGFAEFAARVEEETLRLTDSIAER